MKPNVRLYGRGKLANSTVGEYTYIHSSVIAHTTIGRFCSIAPGNFIAQGEHPVNFLSTHPLFYSPNVDWQNKFSDKEIIKEHSRVIIANDVWIGAGCYIKDGVKIGNGAIIASGSVVVKDVPDYAIVGGVPAKIIKYRFDNDIIEKLLELKWWDKSIDKLKKCKEFFQQNLTQERITEFINCLQSDEQKRPIYN